MAPRPSPHSIWVMMAMAVLALLSVEAAEHMPIQPPVVLKESLSAPRSVVPPPSTSLPLLEVPLSPEARSAGLYAAEDFPDQPPPRPNVNQEPLPLSPPGTYLHTAVLIDGKMYVYGGVASYEEDKYFNDMWLFDFGASEYVQLQGNYVPPPPNHAGLTTGEAAAFAPHDVPAMPNMATAPRHEHSQIEKLHPEANPISPFVPTRRAQRPVRVMPLEHIYAKDADKPTAAGVTMSQIHNGATLVRPAFEIDEEQSRLNEQISLERKRLEELEKKKNKLLGKKAPKKAKEASNKKSKSSKEKNSGSKQDGLDKLRRSTSSDLEETKQRYIDAALKQVHADMLSAKAKEFESLARKADKNARDAKEFRPHRHEPSFLETEEHLDLSNQVHHRARLNMLARTIRAIEDARRFKNPASSVPFMRAGGAYADVRHHRDGVAADYASPRDGRPIQDSATQQHHPNTETPTSAPSNFREQQPHALQDFWQYEFDTHEWSLVGVNSSQPLAHSPWLTPQQLNDPVFKDPLPVLLPPTRRLHTAVVMKDRMIVFGGVSYNNLILGDLWIFDPEEASWIEASADGPGGSPILPREGHSAVTTKDGLTMLVFGGVSYGFLPFNDLWSYSAVDNAWYRLSHPNDQTLPMQRWLHTAIYHEVTDSMVIFGGITAHYVPLNDVHVYSVATNTWRLQPCLDTPPFPRMMHTAVTINDIMLISGGAANNLPMDDMYLLDLKTWRWKELLMTGGYPFARTGATAIILSPRLRGAEKLELEDLSADADDPHLQYKVDQAKVAAREVVGSFSSEGIASHEEQSGNTAGLDAIAFPANPVVDGDNEKAAQRPIYRYRKHAKNNYYMILFGGASATSAPQDQTHLVKDQDEDEEERKPSSFLELDAVLGDLAQSDADSDSDAASSSSTLSDFSVDSEFASALQSVQQAESHSQGLAKSTQEFEQQFEQALGAGEGAEAESDSETESESSAESTAEQEQDQEAEIAAESEHATESELEAEAVSQTEVDTSFDAAWNSAVASVQAEEGVSSEETRSVFNAQQQKDLADLGSEIFLEVESSFSPDQVREHKSGQIGRMRAKRVRAARIQNRVRTPSAAIEPRQGEETNQYGPYDERSAVEDAKPMSPELGEAMDSERKQRLGTVRAVGLARAPFCATYPWCQQTPPPPDMAELPPPENPEIVRQEMARLDPMKFLPIKLEELKKDPYRFGQVFQSIYDTNKHNEKLANKMASPE